MPVNFLSDAERLQFDSFPNNLTNHDLIVFFTVSQPDLRQIPKSSTPSNQLGFILQLLILRFLGFYLSENTSVPDAVIQFVADQLGIVPAEYGAYGKRPATLTAHRKVIEKYLGFTHPDETDLVQIQKWLSERALEHNGSTLLLNLLNERFLHKKLIRPGISVMERMVATAREQAEITIFQQVESIIDDTLTQQMDSLIQSAEPNAQTPLSWLRQSADSNTPQSILQGIEKLKLLQKWQVIDWNLSQINSNRRKQLAQTGFRSTAQALSRMNKQRRYPILLAFISQLYEEIIDELIELFDRLLANISRRADRRLITIQQEIAVLAGDKVKLLQKLLAIIIDPDITDDEVRARIYKHLPEQKLRLTFDECQKINEPLSEDSIKLIGAKYSYLRQFIPAFLGIFHFEGSSDSQPLRDAIEILCDLNDRGKRRVPENAPCDFVDAQWSKYVFDEDEQIVRKYYELCVLFELRKRIRSGDIWLEGSRRYARMESYLIGNDDWQKMRADVCGLLTLPEDGAKRLNLRQAELQELFYTLDNSLGETKRKQRDALRSINVRNLNNQTSSNIDLRIEKGKLAIKRLPGEERPLTSILLEEEVSKRLPEVDLAELLMEVDSWTNFSVHFEHPSGNEPRSPDTLKHCYASILTQACNFSFAEMQRMSGLTYRKLAWYTNWYLREETFKSAFAEIINFHTRLPLSSVWGSGNLSSSDGQRFPVSVRTKNAVAIPRYFGYSKGLTYYTWTSDQYTQYGTKVIPSTIRDATYVLDEILNNETELTILEHTTDTAGYTHLVFGLFDLLGMQFSPRIADIADKTLYCVDKKIKYKNINSLIKYKIDIDLIIRHWDDLLRIAGSLKYGYVTSSLLVSKMQNSGQKQNIARALEEYGKLNETIFILKYLQSPEYQKKITIQLNKGEALHALRRKAFVANEGKIRKRNQEDQLNQASALNLLVNAITAWNTVYIQAALNQLKSEGYRINEDDLKHLSPARSEHINMYGKYYFNVEEELLRTNLRELKKPEKI